jgi:prepilin-type N-terminal cleavage/methylation domain-containing protein
MMKITLTRTHGFTLTEVMISSAIFSAISLGLLMGFASLERSFSATTDFATNHSDQMRVSDYLALDLRRALSVHTTQNDTTITIPAYYDANGTPQTPTLPNSTPAGNATLTPPPSPTPAVCYGVCGSSTTIHYYLAGSAIYRQQGSQTPVAIAENVKDFVFNVTDMGKVMTTKITFNPIFISSGASANATQATAFYNTILLRNVDVY